MVLTVRAIDRQVATSMSCSLVAIFPRLSRKKASILALIDFCVYGPLIVAFLSPIGTLRLGYSLACYFKIFIGAVTKNCIAF